MVAAKRQGMTNGDYVYIVSTISDIHQVEGVDYWWNGISGIVDKAEVEKAWHSVLTLVPRPYNYTKYERFQERVIAKAKAFQWKRSNETQSKVSRYRRDFISSLLCFRSLGMFYCSATFTPTRLKEKLNKNK